MANIFEAAQAAYKDSVDDVAYLSSVVGAAMNEKGVKFDPTKVLRQFDIILQYSMLEAAIGDRVLDRHEVEFIKDLTIHGDFCTFLTDVGNQTVTWADIYNSDLSDLAALMVKIAPVLEDLATEFIAVFAAADCALPGDYTKALLQNVILVLAATCQADGDTSDAEAYAGSRSLIVAAIAKIAELQEN